MPEVPSTTCVVVGGGGHARVVIDSLQAVGSARIHGILDANRSLWGTTVLGVPVLGGDELLAEMSKAGVNAFVVGVGSVRSNAARRRIYENGIAAGLAALVVLHPSATCSPWAQVGPGSVVFAGAVINAGATVGANAIINTGAIVEHDCCIGEHVHVASGARLSGMVWLGNEVFVGAGATVKQGVRIGAAAIIGAGAVVLQDVGEGDTVVGVPAKRVGAKQRERS